MAWEGIELPVAQTGLLVGRNLPVEDLLARAAQLGLGLPDGSLHPVAEGWLASEAHRIASGLLC